MKVKAIVIKSIDGIIAVNNKLPWKHKEDMDHFKRLTKGDAVVMGSRTWDTLYIRPLPCRYNIVMSQHLHELQYAAIAHSMTEAIYLAEVNNFNTLWVIGGADIYNLFANRIDEWHITEVNEIVGSGLKLEPLNKDIWECRERIKAATFNGMFKTYIRKGRAL